ncbi:glycoside hydrolase family 2 TIM barrel-domain containing protein [Chitinophaga rhizophila]|uniref:Glycoside hydrolase family 2 catalytic domain-containing protein n=1 Tax=Chitinophaga rhizophila TaxID=2866212 RepID=A0ABS7GJ57_9BACT|nr:glycoside hydrolase family 2 TIM barrel-domain containing protein [Chitinophaga rhizophila]MBW8687743.1 hypothetical protein [Chitinophaga rhizophila]
MAPAISNKYLVFACFLMLSLYACKGSPATRRGKVYIASENGKYILYRNNQPFLVKGGAGYTYMSTLKAIGGNTIRTWDTTYLQAILDEAANNGLAVIAGFYVPESKYLYDFYQDEKQVTAQYNAYRDVVKRYRSHPALLMWCLGNEVDFPYRPTYNRFYTAYNDLVEMIHAEDPDHPVTTTMINYQFRNILNLRMKVPGIDLISFNTFGDLKQLEQKLTDNSWLWNGPFLITEWGIYSPQESLTTAWSAPIEPTSTEKAKYYHEFYTTFLPVSNPRFLGAMTFYWGNKTEVTPTWYSIIDQSGAKTALVQEMEACWTNRQPAHPPPAVERLLVNGKKAMDNIFLRPDTIQTATLQLTTPDTSQLRIYWKVTDEDFDPRNIVRPLEYETYITPHNSAKITFRSPAKEGPYRLYSWVYDIYGNIATANTPFYVIGTKSNTKEPGHPANAR